MVAVWNVESMECVKTRPPWNEKLQHKLKNYVGKGKAAKETEAAGEFSTTTAVAATMVWPWCSLPSHALLLLERRVLCFALDCRSCLWSFVLGVLGLFCKLSWLDLASTSLLSPKTRSIYANLQSKPKQAETMRNWRNMGINRKNNAN